MFDTNKEIQTVRLRDGSQVNEPSRTNQQLKRLSQNAKHTKLWSSQHMTLLSSLALEV